MITRLITISWLLPLFIVSVFTTQFFFFLFSLVIFLLTSELLNFRNRKFLLPKICLFILIIIQQIVFYYLFFIYEKTLDFFQIIFLNVFFIFVHYFLTNIFFIYYYQKKQQKLLSHISHQLFIGFYAFFVFNHIFYLKYLYRFFDSFEGWSFDPFLHFLQISVFDLFFLFAISITWFFDVFAYTFGYFLGKKNKLNIAVSPRKSWAGLIGGTLFSGLSFYITYQLLNIYYPQKVQYTFFQQDFFWYGILLSLGLGLLSQLGDLFASLHKRSQNIKDSGSIPLLRGHGGVYDRMDSIILTCFFSFYIFYFYFLVVFRVF